MIKVFECSQAATEFALEFNEQNDDMMAIRQEGFSCWSAHKQLLFFPVLIIRREAVMETFDMLHRDFGYEEAEIGIARQTLSWICSEYPDCRLLKIGRWSSELWIPSTADSPPPVVLSCLSDSNKAIAKSLGERWGRMGAVSPQPDQFCRGKGIYKLGVQ